MKPSWGILIGILLYVSSLLHATGVAEYPPTLRRGSLDLRNWDFSTQGIVRVQGEAEFYWNQLRYPTQGTAFVAPLPSTVFQVPENVEYARIPAAWNTLPGRNYPPFGYATYRLLVYLPPDLPVWGIYMSNQDTSYRLYANGRVVSENGTVGTTRDTSIPHRRPVLLFLPANKEGMELIVQVSNFQHRWGGLNNSILIGLPGQILAVNRFYYAYFLVLFGGFLLLSLFHGVQYTFRPSDRSHLFLAASALVLSLRLVFTGEYLAYQFFPRIPWELGIKYEYLSIPLFLCLFYGFLREHFPQDVPAAVVKGVRGVFSIGILAVILLPFHSTSTGLTVPIQLASYAGGGGVLSLVVRTVRRKRIGSLWLALGIAGILLAAGWDILCWNQVLPRRLIGPMLYLGFLFFGLMNSLSLSRRTAWDYQRLDYLSSNLEQEVTTRTQELLAANRTIEETLEAQKHFFIHLSHEIKTPLTLILNYFNTYISRQGLTPELEVVKKNLDRLRGDIIDFFDVFKWSKGKELYTHACTSDFSRLLEEKLILMHSSFKKKNLTVDTEIEEGLIVRADPSALDRVIMNLLDNAVKYNREGGFLRVRAVRDVPYSCLVFSVEDSGVGIPEENLSDVFLPYYRVNETGERIDGVGVGLAVVKHIVESLGGTISCQPSPEGGCVFTLRIPLEAEGQPGEGKPAFRRRETLTSSEPVLPPPPPVTSEGILVVEDEPEMRDLLVEELGTEYRVHTADDGRKALELLQGIEKPSLILSDVMMKEMSGVELLREVQKNPRLRDIPFLLCTARGFDEGALEAYESGALDFVFKPFVMSELKAKIHSLLRFARLRAELAKQERLLGYGIVLSGLAHEIRNPLSGISGPLAVIQKQVSLKAASLLPLLEKHFQYIDSSIRKIDRFAEHMKHLYRDDQVPLQALKLKPLVQDVLSNEISIPKGIHVQIDCPEGYRLLGDEVILRVALVQLLRNSLKALGNAGTIRIWVEEGSGSRAFYLEDDGPGVGPDLRERIFDPFFTTRPGEGMGLGLSVARQLLVKINWTLGLVSFPRPGACFRIEDTNYIKDTNHEE